MIKQSVSLKQSKQELINCISSFQELYISPNLLRGIYAYGFQKPCLLQIASLKHLKQGKNLFVKSQKYLQKVATYTIGILQKIQQQSEHLQAIIIAPTRQHAQNINSLIDKLSAFTRIRSMVVIGGQYLRQDIKRIKQNHPQCLVTTPGRVLHFIQRGIINIDHVKIVVLNEIDQIVVRGFMNQVKQIFQKSPANIQSLLFCATMPQQVIQIKQKLIKNPVNILANFQGILINSKKQYKAYRMKQQQKLQTLVSILQSSTLSQSIIYVNTQQKLIQIQNHLKSLNDQTMILDTHTQDRRIILKRFMCAQTKILVTTDLNQQQARILPVNLIINYELYPCISMEQYIHRLGICPNKASIINLITEIDIGFILRLQNFFNMEMCKLPSDLSKLFQQN